MLWDVFCRVIDNYGDIGVCWRLARDLCERGQRVRLWVDDASALAWMAPGALDHPSRYGVEVHAWQEAAEAHADDITDVGDVVIEAFGCDPPEAFLARMQSRTLDGAPPCWINLEYLSAEDYVSRSHRLRSPVWRGPAAGLSKHFFYPGFTTATGGLLREVDLLAERQRQTGTDERRRQLLKDWGIPWHPGQGLVLVFCYAHAPLGAFLDRLSASAESTLVLLAPGPATELGQAWHDATHPPARHPVQLHRLPHLDQTDFDKLLWCTDLNIVRGEDSAVRALWAGRPHIWHIYPQDDGVHATKLAAFMARWMQDWPSELRAHVSAWWEAFNHTAPQDALNQLPATLPNWRQRDGAWRLASEASRATLSAQTDLTSRLLEFVTSSG